MAETAPSPPHSKRERRKEARPGELLQAALDLFVEKGYAATRVEEVAARAGVSKGTLFLYFPSKEELFKAVVRENIVGRFSLWRNELMHYEGSTADMLRYGFQSWWESIGSTGASGITKLIMSEAGNFPDLALFYQQEVVEPGQQLIRSVLQRGMDRGEFRPMPLDYAVFAILAPMIFLMLWKHSFSTCVPSSLQFDPEVYLQHQVETLLQGLLA